MENEMEKQLLAVLESQLPAQTAGVLKKYIEDAQKSIAAFGSMQKRIEKLTDENIKMQSEIYSLKDENEKLKKDEENVRLREIKVSEKEIRQYAEEAKIRQEAAEKITEKIFNLAEIAFKNPRLVHNETGTVAMVAPTGGYATNQPYGKMVTVEETK